VTPRIAPGGRRDVGLFAWTFAQVAGRVTGTNPPNLFLTIARRPALFRGWLRFAARLMPRGRLPRRDTELVILRVAHLRGCDYEFRHHVHLSRKVGITARDVERVQVGSCAQGWTPREQALLHAAEQLLDQRNLDDRSWTAAREHLSEADAVEFVLLVGHYDMLATFLLTLGVVPDVHR
jgi:AhpD family alkylhydroperoxidase